MQSPNPPESLALAFYNGLEHGRLLDRIIARHDRGRSAGPYSHVELVFNPHRAGLPVCFSSSWRDGGVRFKRIDLSEAGRWSLVPLAVTGADVNAVRSWCLRHVGGRYDVPGVLAFKLPLVRHRLNWWFCSEVCVAALQEVGLLPLVKAHRTTPNALHHLLAATRATPLAATHADEG